MRRYVVLTAIAIALYIAQGEFREYLQANQLPVKRIPAISAAIPTAVNPNREAASIPSELPSKSRAMEIADKYLESHRTEWKLQPFHEFRAVEFRTPLGTKINYSVFQDGIPVLNLGISIQIERDLTVGKVENNYVPIARAMIQEKERRIGSLIPVLSDRYTVTEDPKQVTPPVIVVPPGSIVPQVAYQLSVIDEAKNREPLEILFRATDGQILGKTKPRLEF